MMHWINMNSFINKYNEIVEYIGSREKPDDENELIKPIERLSKPLLDKDTYFSIVSYKKTFKNHRNVTHNILPYNNSLIFVSANHNIHSFLMDFNKIINIIWSIIAVLLIFSCSIPIFLSLHSSIIAIVSILSSIVMLSFVLFGLYWKKRKDLYVLSEFKNISEEDYYIVEKYTPDDLEEWKEALIDFVTKDSKSAKEAAQLILERARKIKNKSTKNEENETEEKWDSVIEKNKALLDFDF